MFSSNQYAMNICGHWSLYIIFHSNLKIYIFFVVVCSYMVSCEIVVGQADFSSPPDRLSCKVWDTFVNSVNGLYRPPCHI